MNTSMYSLFKGYIDNNISIIPCRVTKKDDGTASGKRAAVQWTKYLEEVADEDEIKSWASTPNIRGFGIVTGELSNIACIDIDTTNASIAKRVLDVKFTPCLIKGATGRGGKLLYRLCDSVHDYKAPDKSLYQFKDNNGKVLVEIFLGNKYVCAPPSFHSSNEKESICYEWKEGDGYYPLLDVGVENLPVLEARHIEEISLICRGMTTAEISKNMPQGGNLNLNLQEVESSTSAETGRRYEDMKSHCSSLIAQKLDPSTAVKELLMRDDTRNEGNPYFLDPDKGFNSNNPNWNALTYYMDILKSHNRGKSGDDLEVPDLKYINPHVERKLNQWVPIKHTTNSRTLPPFNYKWIPDSTMRKYIQEGATANSVSPQNIYFYMLCSLSSVIGNKIKIRPYKNNHKYTETCNLYVGNVAPSGARKTAAAKAAMAMLSRLDKTAKEKNIEDLKKNRQLSEDIKVQINKKKKDRKKELEQNGHEAELAKTLLEEISQLEKDMPKFREVSLYEQQTTVERLYEICEDNPTGLFVEWDELGPKWKDLTAKGGEKALEFYIKGWDGQSYFSNRTKHNGENFIDELALSVGFSTQPDIMQGIVAELKRDKFSNNGFLQRFLIFHTDRDRQEFCDMNYKTPDELHGMFENAFYIEKSEMVIPYTDEAYAQWKIFSDELIDKVEVETNSAIRSSLGKYSGQMVRMSGILEIVKCNGTRPSSISLDSVKLACEIVNYAEAHLRYIFSLQDSKEEEDILDLFKLGIVEDGTTVRELCRSHQSVFGNNSDEALAVIKTLSKRGILKLVKDGKARRIKINPSLLSNLKEQ